MKQEGSKKNVAYMTVSRHLFHSLENKVICCAGYFTEFQNPIAW
jgi:hypothetical protein